MQPLSLLPRLLPVFLAVWLCQMPPAFATAMPFGALEKRAFPSVVVSIKPIHALVSGVMQGVGEPVLLVPGNASPHSYALRPSQAGALAQADAVFLVNRNFEVFLQAPLRNLTRREVTIVELSRGQTLYPYRSLLTLEASYDYAKKQQEQPKPALKDTLKGVAAPTEAPAEADKDDDHAPQGMDYHLWLDPQRAILMVKTIARTLSHIDSANAAIYSRNAENLTQQLQSLDREVMEKLSGQPNAETDVVPYLVYHDAYQYFERHYHLAPAAALARNPEQGSRARTYADIAKALKGRKLRCVLREPQFDARIVQRMAEESGAKIVTVTPDGSLYPEGEEAYFHMIRDLAGVVADCRRL